MLTPTQICRPRALVNRDAAQTVLTEKDANCRHSLLGSQARPASSAPTLAMATVSPVPLAMQPAVAAAAPGQSSKIHEAALRMLASLGAAIAKRPSAALSSALRAVAGKLGDVEPMSMMGDLHTPSVPSGETVPETLLKVVASSTKSKKSAADQALGEAGSDGWVSAKLPEGKSSYLITLAAPMHLSGIRFAFDKKHAPATVEVLAEDANTGTVVRMLDPASGSLFMEPLVVPFGAGIFSGRVVLRMTGSAKGGKDSAVHSLRSLAVGRFVSPPSPASGQMGSVVGSVAAMLAESCAGSDASLRDAALLALCNLFKATASGSVGMLLLNVSNRAESQRCAWAWLRVAAAAWLCRLTGRPPNCLSSATLWCCW